MRSACVNENYDTLIEVRLTMCESCGCTPCEACGAPIEDGVCSGCGEPAADCICEPEESD